MNRLSSYLSSSLRPLFRKLLKMVLLGALLGTTLSLAADVNNFPRIQVNGLFGSQAVLTIDGKQRLLKRGQRSPEGVLLVSSTLSQVVLKYGSNTRTIGLSRHVAGSFRKVEKNAITIGADPTGHFRVQLTINGQPVSSLVDTGATVIAMSSAQATKLGIDYLAGELRQVTTASGRVDSYFVTLDTVMLGSIAQRNVPAAVVQGLYPEEVLLGMSFLGTLSLAEKNGTMTIAQLY